ncbi:MAG: M24 family metallopeptidase [Candidatus Nanoarchaeia archaeon]
MENKRMRSIKDLMSQKKLDSIVLTTNSVQEKNANMFYITNFEGVGILIFKKEPVLLVSSVEIEKAEKTGTKTILLKKENRKETITKALGNSKRIGVDKSTITLSQYEEIKKISGKNKSKFFDIGKELLDIRAVKEEQEIKNVKIACETCDEIFSLIINNFKFKTEEELAAFIEIEIKKRGLEKSFNPIVSSSKNASDIHHNPKGKITKGFLILDFGCKINNYCSDMTRTIYIGKPSSEEKKIYEDLLNIQNTALALAMPGKKCSEIDLFAREMLGARFSHNLGHGVGIEIHETPNLTSTSKDILKENTIITIEPGVYKEGKYGIRIEDTVLVTKKGPIRLTRSKKELIVIKQVK